MRRLAWLAVGVAIGAGGPTAATYIQGVAASAQSISKKLDALMVARSGDRAAIDEGVADLQNKILVMQAAQVQQNAILSQIQTQTIPQTVAPAPTAPAPQLPAAKPPPTPQADLTRPDPGFRTRSLDVDKILE